MEGIEASANTTLSLISRLACGSLNSEEAEVAATTMDGMGRILKGRDKIRARARFAGWVSQIR